MRTLTIKLEPQQHRWLARQARLLKKSKGEVIRELIQQTHVNPRGSVGEALADLCGCLNGSKNLSTRSLKRYGQD